MAKQILPAWGGAFILGAGGALGVGLVVLSSELRAAGATLSLAVAVAGCGVVAVAAVVACCQSPLSPAAPLPVLVARVLRLCALPVLALWAGLVLLRATPALLAALTPEGSSALLLGLLILLAFGPTVAVAGAQLRAGLCLYAALQAPHSRPAHGILLAMLGGLGGALLALGLQQLAVEASLLALVGGLCSLLGGWAVVARYAAPQRLYMLLGTAALMMLVGWLLAAAWLLEGATLTLQGR
jgi:hypothetical protein